jgi:hypothetical protein
VRLSAAARLRSEATALAALFAFLAGVGVSAPSPGAPADVAAPGVHDSVEIPAPEEPTLLPSGQSRVFPGHVLVAYYGTAGTGALGVLGEDTPDKITARLRRAAKPFGQTGYRVQIVYELIVSIADAGPGPGGDYSHDISRDAVERYIRAAHRNEALLVLDLQPGRSDFLTVAKRWAWALKDPWVGLALDPEWRMGPGEVPGQTIGQVRAGEVNRVSAWLRDLSAANDLPEKIFMLHQFRTDMIIDIDAIRPRTGLAMVQHVDGFGTQSQKRDTYQAVEEHDQFWMGLKLFYDEDINMFTPRQVLRVRPQPRFVSYQ